MPLVSTRRCYLTDEQARDIYQSTETYEEMSLRLECSIDVIRDIRCARGRWKRIVAGLTKGKTLGRNQFADTPHDATTLL